MTKPLTAVSILMLMEEGKLLASDPVSKHIAEFKNPRVAVWRLPNDATGAGATLVPAAREITIRDLLTHTSGLASGFAGPAGDFVRRANLPSGGSLDERVRRLAPLPLNFQPGSQWEYSAGTGFDTLGRIVEIQSGMNLAQFFKARIFDPLGMNKGENGWLGTPGDYGWAGGLGTYFWIDPKEQLVGMILIQTPIRALRMEFPNAVYQAFID